ncbi:uncharacterized protein LOC119558919 [Drosophila subpulchrella]|uniref:uncharacterized protein LOC119558919 n=1 Tax=Drosophila subpulchrella TaxID=1486046 RepID=UPI0018A1528B|nr:uncharacterized protein LOC119558919 [Drosophila subpulchrella]
MVTSSDPSTSAAVVSRTLEDVLKAFDDYSIPFRNITMESYKFNNIVQTEGRPFIEFETQLRKQVQLCDYKCDCGRTYEERMLLDRFIIGIQDKRLQLKLLESYKFNNIVQTEGRPFIEFETQLRKQVQLCDYKCDCGRTYEERMLLDRFIIGIQDKRLQLKLLESKNKKLEEIITECKAFEAAAKNNEFLRNPHYESPLTQLSVAAIIAEQFSTRIIFPSAVQRK